MKTIKIRKDDKGNLYLPLDELIPGHINDVDSYTMEEIYDEGRIKLMMQFFDKDGNVVNVNEERR